MSGRLAMGAVLALIVAAGVAVLALAGGDEAPAPQPAARQASEPALKLDRFDSAGAWAELVRQVELGPRPAGSDTLRALAARLRDELPDGRFERVRGHARLRNVEGRLPGRGKAIVISAHYDTKDIPGFVGANDGAAGTAVVMELARALAEIDRPRGAPPLRFVLFDGEEATDDSRPFEATGLRGSKAYARRHAGELRTLILLDFVGAKQMRIRREANSDVFLWDRLQRAAAAVGAESAFPRGVGPAVTDDHVPFLRRGVRAIDLIQWPYDCWHEPCDDLTAVEERSLDITGETVLELIRRLSRK